MRTKIISVAALSVAIGTPAMAQDLIDGPFTGPRVEVLAGYDIAKIENELLDPNAQTIAGPIFGGGIGYDMDVGGIVLGIEGEYNKSQADEFVEGDSSEPNINGTIWTYKSIGDVDFGRELYAGLRAGALVRTNILAYAKGGYTNSKFSVAAFDRKYTAQGYRIGGGVEYSFSERLFAKLEYRYSDYGETPVYYYYFSTGRAVGPSGDFNLKRHQIIAGAGYRF